MNLKWKSFRLGCHKPSITPHNIQNGVCVPPWLFENFQCAASVERLRYDVEAIVTRYCTQSSKRRSPHLQLRMKRLHLHFFWSFCFQYYIRVVYSLNSIFSLPWDSLFCWHFALLQSSVSFFIPSQETDYRILRQVRFMHFLYNVNPKRGQLHRFQLQCASASELLQ